ncbi:DNA methyltransferase [Micromonospora tarensis]|uniref:DNA methyltransferase n=1 Tax=Micromonospora tarensis TaxID=2806100 RepID=UPI0038991562
MVQDQPDARVCPRPPIHHLRTAVPAHPITHLLFRPRPHPDTAGAPSGGRRQPSHRRARKGATGGIGATARRRGATAYGSKYAATNTAEPRASAGNLKPLGHAHTAAHVRGRNPGDVWRIATRPYRGSHIAPFPIDLPLRAIAAGCPASGVVLDPFSGASTTGLAAMHLGRRYLGIDIAEQFHHEAITRLRPHLAQDTT